MVASALLIFGCQKPQPEPQPEPQAKLSVSPTSLAFEKEASEKTLTITANQSWKATVEGKGFSLSSSSGTGNAEIKVSAKANESADSNDGKITITSGSLKAEVTLTQKGENAVINITGGSFAVSGEGGTVEVAVQYNAEFNVTINDDAKEWLSYNVTDTKALKDGKIVFTAKHNYCPERKTIVKISGKADGKEICTIEIAQGESRFRQGLMKLFNTLEAGSWPSGWGSDSPYTQWGGVTDKTIELLNCNLKGELPDCFEDFADYLESFTIGEMSSYVDSSTYPDNIKGTLPPSFGKLKKLKSLVLGYTSMTSLPDIFYDMPDLSEVHVIYNFYMTGPLPKSLGISPSLKRIEVQDNSFTGGLPEEWCNTDKVIRAYWNHLSGSFPQKFYNMPSVAESFWECNVQLDPNDPTRQSLYLMDFSNAPFIPGNYNDQEFEDYDGSHFKISDLIGKNKYTILLYWGITNPYGNSTMMQVKKLYDMYHDQGLEVVAFATWDMMVSQVDESKIVDYLKANGMDKWHNVRLSKTIPSSFPNVAPSARVITQDNHLIFSYEDTLTYGDMKPEIFNKTASIDLMPFVQELYGDLDREYVSKDFSKDGEVMTLQKATKGNGINIVFMGDAYTDKDMNSGGLYETVMKDAMNAFFDIEPYKTFRDRFNVYLVKAVSKNCKTGTGYETRFSTYSDPDSRRVDGDVNLCLDYARKAAGVSNNDNLTVITLINSNDGGATCHSMIGYNSSVAFINAYNNMPELYGEIVQHEGSGHGFGHLADEYVEHDEAPTQSWIDSQNSQYKEKNWWANIDFTNDPEKVKWARFLKDSRYTSSTGIFEGGGTFMRGVWRPSEDSMMNDYAPYFNAPSREAIYRRIMELSGEGYSWEKFLEYDAVNLQSASKSTTAKRRKAKPRSERLHSDPVIVR